MKIANKKQDIETGYSQFEFHLCQIDFHFCQIDL